MAAAARSKLRWLGVAVGGLLGLLVLLISLLHTPPARRYALKQIVQIMGKQGIRFDSSRFDYNLLNLTATLEDVVIQSPQAADLPPLLRANRVYVDIGLRSLIGGKLVVEDASIGNPQVHLVFDENGRSNIPSLQKQETEKKSDTNYLIDKLVVTGGDLRVEDRRLQISAHLPLAELTMDGNPLTDNHDITLKSGAGGVVSYQGRTLPLQGVSADALLKTDGAEIRKLTASFGPSTLAVSGTVDNFDNPTLDIKGDANLVLDSLLAFGNIQQPLAGAAHVAFTATGTVERMVARASVAGEDLAVDRLRGVDIKAEAEYDAAASRARVSSMNVSSPSGAIQGKADLALTPAAGKSTANISVRNVDLYALSATFKAPVRIASRGTADIAAHWPAMEFRQAAGDATVRLTPTRPAPAKDVVPVAAILNAKTQGNRTVVGIRDLRALDAQARGQVTLVNQQALGGTIQLQAPQLSSTIAAAEAFLGKAPGSLVGPPVDGTLELAANLHGTVQSPALVAQVGGSGLSVGDLQGIDLQAKADYNPTRVVLEDASVRWRDQVITAAGTVGLKGRDPSLRLTADSQNISIESVLAGLNKSDLPVTGSASFHAEVNGTTRQPEADVRLTASNLTAYKEVLGDLNAEAQLRGRVVNISTLRLDKPQEDGNGILRASGSYNLDGKNYTLDATSENLRVTGFTLPDGRAVRGEIELNARSHGTAEDPSADLKFSAKDVQVGTEKFGSVDLAATAANGQAQVKASVPAFNLTMKADAAIKEPYPGSFEIRADNIDLTNLPVKIDQPVSGRVTATIRGEGPLANFTDAGRATAQIDQLDLKYKEQPIQSDGPIVVHYEKQALSIERATFVARESRISLQGSLPLDARSGEGAITLSAKLDLPSLMLYVPSEKPIAATGTATIDGSIRGNLRRIDPDIKIALADGSFAVPDQKTSVTNVGLQGNIRDGALELQSLTAKLGVATITAGGTVPFALLPADLPVELPRREGSAAFTAELTALNLSDVPGVPANLSGIVSARLEAQAARPDIEALNARLNFPDLRLKVGAFTFEQQGTSEILIEKGVARVGQFLLTGPETKIQVAGTAGLTGTYPLDIKLDGTFDSSIASAFTNAVQTRGAAELHVALSGTAQQPLGQGYLQLNDAQVSMRDPRVGIEDLNVRVDLARNRATLSRLSGTLNGGDLSGSGSLEYAGGGLRNTNLNIKADGVYFNFPEGLKTISDVNLQLKTADENLVVGGQITIIEGGYTDEKLTRNILARVGGPTSLDLTMERSPFVENILFDLPVVTQNPIIIDNSLAEAELTANLRLLGTPYELGLSGRVEILEGGQLRLQERRYVVERGIITFTGERSIEPSLDILATTNAAGYEITLQISGDPGNTETVLTSDPPLPEPDILAVLVTGKTMEEIRGQEFEVARNQVLSYLSGRVGSRIGETLSSATGLSTVRIEPSLIAAEADPSARLTLGQNITRNLELIYSMDLVNSSDQIYIAEYDINRRFTTRGTRQSDGSFRMDFRHEVRFGGVPEPRRGAKLNTRRIGNVSIVGNRYFTDLKLADKLDVKAGDRYDFFKLRKGLDRIERMHDKERLLESNIRLQRNPHDSIIDVTLNVKQGPHVDLVFEGISVPDSIQQKVRDAWREGIFDLQRLEESDAALRSWLVKDHYLQPKIDHAVTETSEDRKRVVFDIQPGTPFKKVDLVFDGANGVKPSTLKDIVEDQKLSVDVYVTPGRVTELLTRFYREKGFLDAEVAAPTYELNAVDGSGRVVFPVIEGPLYKVGEVSFAGNAAVASERLSEAVPLPKGEVYQPVLREHALQRLKDVYWELGYNDVDANMTLIRNKDEGKVDIAFNISENRRSIVHDVVVEGNVNTSQSLILTQLELNRGDVLDLKKLGSSRRNLYHSGAYSLVEIAREDVAAAEAKPGEKHVLLRVKVREIQPFEVKYGAFFDTERGPGAIIDIANRNSLGSARVLGLRTRYDTQLQEARLYFSQPLLRRFPVKTIASPFYRRERNPGTQTADAFNVNRIGFSLQQEARPWEKYLLNYGYRIERTRTFSPVFGLLDDQPVRIGSLTSTLSRETRDEIMDATRGSFMSHALQWSPAILGSQQRFIKYFGQYFKYIPLQRERVELFTNKLLRPRLVYAGGVRAGLATGFGDDAVPLSERFLAGGGTSIRGFEQNTVGPVGRSPLDLGGEAMLIINNEMRFPLFWIIDGAGFVDVGNVWRNASEFSFIDIRKTGGAGLRMRTPWFLLRVDYGMKLDRRAGESRGRFFFSIGQAF